MFVGKLSIAKIGKIHFWTLQFVYNSCDKLYHDLLKFSNDVSIHQKHLRFLTVEVYKSLMNINPEFMWEFFNKNPVHYNLKKGCNLSHICQILLLCGSLLWNSLPSNVIQSHYLEELKLKLGKIHSTCFVHRWNWCNNFILLSLLCFFNTSLTLRVLYFKFFTVVIY